MSDFISMLDRAAGAAVCGFLANGGNMALAPMVVKGAMVPGGQVPAAAAGLGLMALNAGCAFDPAAGAPAVGDYVPQGCYKATGNDVALARGWNNGNFLCCFAEFVSMVKTDPNSWPNPTWKATGRQLNGDLITNEVQIADSSVADLGLYLRPGGTCLSSDPPGYEPPDPVTYVDATTSCSMDVTFQAWYVADDGRINPVLKIEPTPSVARASGGVISGCNFTPVVYVGPGGPGGGGGGGGGGDDGPHVFPWDPDGQPGPGGEPWWLPIVKTAIGSAIGNLVAGAIRDLFSEDPALATAKKVAEVLVGSDSGVLPAVTYDLTEACPEDGTTPQTHEIPIPEAPALTALAARSDALELITQDLKSWKQPTCNIKPQLTGDWVTVNFLSDEPSPLGDRRLRKLLRYRDQTSSPQETHIAHWENFSWQAGPVMVVSKNLSWGTPQVWASTAEEGKRVIGHAAQVAGVDLTDAKHQWVVSYSSDPRYGQPGTMRIDTRGGRFARVTMRNGPNGLPLGRPPAP